MQMENRTNGKWQLPVVCRKRKIGTANFHLFAANRIRKRKFVFFGRQFKRLSTFAISGSLPIYSEITVQWFSSLGTIGNLADLYS
jgi:tricorn protease-like protein